MKNCKTCSQPLPESLTYRTAPEKEVEPTKSSWKPNLYVWPESLWVRLSKSKIISIPLRFGKGLITGVSIIGLIITIVWLLGPGIYHFGNFVNNHTFNLDLTVHNSLSWLFGVLCLLSPLIIYVIHLLGDSFLKEVFKK